MDSKYSSLVAFTFLCILSFCGSRAAYAVPPTDPCSLLTQAQVSAVLGVSVETAQHVVRRLLREDRTRGVSVAVNEYAPHTGSTEHPITHEGFEYGFVLEGELTVEVDGSKHVLQRGDLISYSSRRKHKIWNHADTKVRTLWFNLDRE